VRVRDGSVIVEPLKPWKGTATDELRSIGDLLDALANTLDRKRTGAPDALALKRTETTRARPTKQYDQKIRAEGAAMIAAASQGKRYFHYRKNQLGRGSDLAEKAGAHSKYPAGAEAQDAVAAACAALTELRSEN